MLYEHRRPDVAVFIDFENVYVSVRDKLDANPNFESIIERCNELGRVIMARAYADWYRYPRITSALYANSIEPMYVPTYYYDKDMGRTGRAIKNSVDMNLCIDVMKALFTHQNVERFVLVTGDRDFIPLVNSIRQQGKEVIVIGIGGAASTHLAQSADEFIFYEQLVGKSTPASIRAGQTAAPGSGSDDTRGKPAEQDVFDTLVAAVHLVRERGYVSTLGSLKLVMKELMGGDFKENRYKDLNGRSFTKFKDFVLDAERRGKVQIFTSGTVNEVFLPGEDPLKLSQFAGDLKEELPDEADKPAHTEDRPAQTNQHPQPEARTEPPSSSSSSRSRRRRRPRGRTRQPGDTQHTQPPATSTPAYTAESTQNGVAAPDTTPEPAPGEIQPTTAATPNQTPSQTQPDQQTGDQTHNTQPDPATPEPAEPTAPQPVAETDIFDSQQIAANAAELAQEVWAALWHDDTPHQHESHQQQLFDMEERAMALAASFRSERTPDETLDGSTLFDQPAAPADTPADPTTQAPAEPPTSESSPPEPPQPDNTAQPGPTMDTEPRQATQPHPAAAPEPAPVQQPDQPDQPAQDDTNDPTTPLIDFTDAEWQAFRSMMTEFTRPVSFSQILERLRELRNQQVITRTNEQLRSLIKQAISAGMLDRTGRSTRIYYTLHQPNDTNDPDQHTANADAASDTPATVSTEE